MEYKLIKINKKYNSILISANNVELWVDYFEEIENGEKFYTWDFNQYIFTVGNSKDDEAKATQEKIYNDVENFNDFMNSIFYEL